MFLADLRKSRWMAAKLTIFGNTCMLAKIYLQKMSRNESKIFEI
jgi:hypothetical protein